MLQHVLPRELVGQVLRLPIASDVVKVDWDEEENAREPANQAWPAMHRHHANSIVHAEAVHAEGADEVPRERAHHATDRPDEDRLVRLGDEVSNGADRNAAGNRGALRVEDVELQVAAEDCRRCEPRHRRPQESEVGVDGDGLLGLGRRVEGVVAGVVGPDHERSEEREDVRLVAASAVRVKVSALGGGDSGTGGAEEGAKHVRGHRPAGAVERPDHVHAHPVVEGVRDHIHEHKHDVLDRGHLADEHAEGDESGDSGIHPVDDVHERQREGGLAEIAVPRHQKRVRSDEWLFERECRILRHLHPCPAVARLSQLAQAEAILDFVKRAQHLAFVVKIVPPKSLEQFWADIESRVR
mmetsp:Transcript_10903/g.21916  ORF Transcript_10903/g.21916 Transcript_10903/m.21916 type:complete len:355 (-) Transcript_10903:716-1780(-)